MTSTQSFADELPPYQPQIVPVCKVYRTSAGEVCGYTDPEEWKSVLRADAELVHLRAGLKNEADRVTAMAIQLEELARQTAAYANSQSVLVQHNTDLTKQLLELDLKYQQERVKPTWGSPLAWTLAGVSTAVLAGMVVASVLD